MGSVVFINICNNRVIGTHSDLDYALKLVRGDVALDNPIGANVSLISTELNTQDSYLVASHKVAVNGKILEVTTNKVYN